MLTSTTRNLAVQPLCSRLWVHLHPQPLPRTHSGRAEAECGLTGLAESRAARAGRRRESNRNSAVLDALGGGGGCYHHLRAPDSEFGLGGAHLGARGPTRAPRMGPEQFPLENSCDTGSSGVDPGIAEISVLRPNSTSASRGSLGRCPKVGILICVFR